jgi:hypothetical protein
MRNGERCIRAGHRVAERAVLLPHYKPMGGGTNVVWCNFVCAANELSL